VALGDQCGTMFVADLCLSYLQHSEIIPLLAKAVHGKSDAFSLSMTMQTGR
jgi:hypothetical protein